MNNDDLGSHIPFNDEDIYNSQENINGHEQDNENDIQQNILAWKNHTQEISRLLQYIKLYYMFQLSISVVELVFKWDQPLAKPFILSVILQFIYHISVFHSFKNCATERLVFLNYLSNLLTVQTNNNYFMTQYEQTKQEYQNQISFTACWNYILENQDHLNFLNKIIMLWMWVFANVIFIIATDQFDSWFMIAQIGIGWFVIIFMTSAATLICLLLPILYCYINYKEYRSRNRRRENLQRIRNSFKSYKEVQNSNNQPCYICLDEYHENDKVVLLPCQNQHMFHLVCLEPWLDKNEFCPVCRSALQ